MTFLLLLGACAVGLEVYRRRQASAQAPTLVPDMQKLWQAPVLENGQPKYLKTKKRF